MKQRLTTRQAASLLGVKPGQIIKYIRQGRLPAEKIKLNRERVYRWMIDLEDVEALKQRREAGGPDFRRGPAPSRKTAQALMYFPRSQEWVTRITEILYPEERAVILEYYARMKREQPEKYQRKFSILWTKGNR